MSEKLISVGVFGAPHGVRGEIRVKSFTADPRSIGGLGVLTDAQGGRRFEIASLRPVKADLFVARVRGIGDRDAAEALTGVMLHVRRDQLPAADEDEFYHADLIGLLAETPAGEALGTVVGVQNFGAGDMVEIAVAGQSETLLLPFTKAVVPSVDIAGRRIVVAPPLETEAVGEGAPEP